MQVDKLIAGLEALGCENTQGEGQILCVMSDSFNALGDAEDLQASGDLPEVDVILVRSFKPRPPPLPLPPGYPGVGHPNQGRIPCMEDFIRRWN